MGRKGEGEGEREPRPSSLKLKHSNVNMQSILDTRLLLEGRTLLPVPLTRVGQAAVALSAVSIFYFCGIFFAHLTLHLVLTRGLLVRPRRGSLTSLEILAIGNGVLMLAPSKGFFPFSFLFPLPP